MTDSTIAAAEHTFLFEFELPTDLPGSFHLASFAENGIRDLDAHIEFILTASVEVDGWTASDLECSEQITVHSTHSSATKPVEQSVTEQVRFLCCLIRGTCHVRLGMDKDTYHLEDIAQIQCHVANNSFVDVNYLRCFLWQDLTLDLNGRARRFSRQMTWAMFPGVRAGTILHVPQGMKIHAQTDQGEMNVTTHGKLVQCAYRVEMECSIPLCPDVILQLPVTVVAHDTSKPSLSIA
ncbi:TPA: hypothetical protein N0F65_007426 [Lagenidium giganteum]|uniref:Arrestin-like N-terminal domain-containing protein n=1 Tax=Lagenidium giganteum TaxID=4803 RepID=A0AAV2ZLR1_9STRA|nr:TPA: hypothetical protein N0F65_007426 [Lagenidium giganteum]